MRLLITGCSGFFARSICQPATRRGFEIVGVGRSARPPGWPGEYFQRQGSSDFADGIRDYAPSAVLHFSGSSSVGSSFLTPLDHLEADILTWANTLDSVRRSGLKPIVFFPSSAAVYGNPEKLPVTEDANLAPISPYGFHKAACELLATEYSECFG